MIKSMDLFEVTNYLPILLFICVNKIVTEAFSCKQLLSEISNEIFYLPQT